jgi:hypothetical protein
LFITGAEKSKFDILSEGWEESKMTVKGPAEVRLVYIGLSTDEKPVSEVSLAARFFETDTKSWFVFNGSTWVKSEVMI